MECRALHNYPMVIARVDEPVGIGYRGIRACDERFAGRSNNAFNGDFTMIIRLTHLAIDTCAAVALGTASAQAPVDAKPQVTQVAPVLKLTDRFAPYRQQAKGGVEAVVAEAKKAGSLLLRSDTTTANLQVISSRTRLHA